MARDIMEWAFAGIVSGMALIVWGVIIEWCYEELTKQKGGECQTQSCQMKQK